MEQIGKYEVRKKLGEGATSEVYFSPKLVAALETSISDAAGPFRLERATPAAGGCIHRSYVLEGGGRKFFSKINERSQSDSFAAEADGLAALAAAGVRVPAPLGRGETRKDAFLVLEYLELHGNGDYSALGRALAAVHSVQREDYGWHRDNYIGATPQLNRRSSSWAGFWREARLMPQLLAGHAPSVSLLHGDLWSGNAGFLAQGAPVLFDPAVYRGDREADISMTELFGGFPQAFYSAYREVAPLDQDYTVRKILYNLYHVLNHANLFGGSYAAQAERMIERLLAEVR